MSNKQMIPIAGLIGTMGLAAYMVVQLNAQTSNVTGDFTNAAVAEVRDAQSRTVLQGQFVAVEEEDDDSERKATLKPTGVDADASGEAEVEFAKTSKVTTQEIELLAKGLEPGARFTFVVDGQVLATATADRRGNVEVELDVKMPGAAASPQR
jgi:hypothetical protein